MSLHALDTIATAAHVALSHVAGIAPVALTQLGRASLQGGVLIAGLWLVFRLVPRLPAAVRQALWALTCVKLVVTLFWTAPITVPVLRPVAPPPTVAALPALPKSKFVAPKLVVAPEEYGPPQRQISTDSVRPAAMPTVLAPTAANVGSIVLLAYAIILALLIGVMLVRAIALRRALRASIPLTDPVLLAIARQCAASMGLRKCPSVRESATAPGPFVTGFYSPTIVLPAGFAPPARGAAAGDEHAASSERSEAELTLALSHEMAHIKRGDLWLALIPAAAKWLFWFHPLVYLAESEFRTATEEACDARTMAITGAEPADYFRLLLSVAEAASPSRRSASAMGLSAGFSLLKRRLDSLANVCGRPVSTGLRLVAVCLTGACLLVMAPFRFTAQARAIVEAALPSYGLGDLGESLSRATAANGISNDGTVVGEILPSVRRGPGKAILWRGGSVVPIDPLPAYRHSDAGAINGNGLVIASAYNYGNFHHAFVWSGSKQALGSLPGYKFSKATGINDAGDVVGSAQTGKRQFGQSYARAFLWQAGRMQDLGTLGGDFSCAYGIDNKGDVVGKADTARSIFGVAATHAFSWHGGAMTDLGTLGGPNSVAFAVSDTGVIVGAADVDSVVRHACIWYRGQISDLGALAPGAISQAHAINRLGQTVGSSTLDAGSPATHAMLWQGGRQVDLNSLLPPGSPWTLEDARGINDHGQIVGTGRLHGRKHAFVLSPVGK